jgi:tryptophanase
MDFPFAESYKIKTVEPVFSSTREQRELWIREAHYNLFNLRSEQVFIDLLTDSGTGAMSARQWAAIMNGDESYAGASSYYRLKKAVEEILGFPYFLPVHQGRAAENVLFSALVKEGDIIPGNAHFDTTKGHIEFRKAVTIDCTINEAYDTSLSHPFKGNVDIDRLEDVIRKYGIEKIPFVILTLTCNTVGGQPVSMENIRQVKNLAAQYGIPLLVDAARFAENAWFIREREAEFRNRSVRAIVTEMLSYADMFTMSSKKDGLVNIGGLIGMRSKEVFDKASVYNIMFEGYLTYGGMAGRDMEALAAGLEEVVDEQYLESRIRQVEFLGKKLDEFGVPVLKPFGGHAVFVDALSFLPLVPREQFVAQTLAVELYREGGVRSAEIGTLMADRDPVTRENRYPRVEYVRLAIPRRVYTDNHMLYTAVALARIFERRNSIRAGYVIVKEQPILRHFTVQLEPVEQ